MRALVLEDRPVLRSDFPDPVAQGDEVLVHVRSAGVCDTDLQLAAGYMGYQGVLGHEFVGRVDAEATTLAGRRVVADINAGCGQCEDCRERDGHHCSTRTVLGILGRHGAMAERLTVPKRCLVEVPDSVPDDHAVFAEPLAAGLHVLDELGGDAVRDSGGPVVVLGDGKLGLLITMALRAAGIDVVAVGHHSEKLALAAAVGATPVLESDLDPDLRVHTVVEATGSAGGLQRAIELCRPRGTVVLKTTVAERLELDLAPVVVNELRLVGSRCGDMARAVQMLETGAIDPTPLISARYGLDDAEQALAHAGRKGTLKVLVDVG